MMSGRQVQKTRCRRKSCCNLVLITTERGTIHVVFLSAESRTCLWNRLDVHSVADLYAMFDAVRDV